MGGKVILFIHRSTQRRFFPSKPTDWLSSFTVHVVRGLTAWCVYCCKSEEVCILAQSASSPADDGAQEEREIKAIVSAHLSCSAWAAPKLPVPPSVWAARLSPIMKYSQVTAFLRNDGDQSIAFQLVIFSPFTAPLTMLTVISAGRRPDRTTNAALSTERSQRLACLSPFSSLPLPSSPLSSPLISTGILSWSVFQTLFPLARLFFFFPPYQFCTFIITTSLSMGPISIHLVKNLFEMDLTKGARMC